MGHSLIQPHSSVAFLTFSYYCHCPFVGFLFAQGFLCFLGSGKFSSFQQRIMQPDSYDRGRQRTLLEEVVRLQMEATIHENFQKNYEALKIKHENLQMHFDELWVSHKKLESQVMLHSESANCWKRRAEYLQVLAQPTSRTPLWVDVGAIQEQHQCKLGRAHGKCKFRKGPVEWHGIPVAWDDEVKSGGCKGGQGSEKVGKETAPSTQLMDSNQEDKGCDKDGQGEMGKEERPTQETFMKDSKQ